MARFKRLANIAEGINPAAADKLQRLEPTRKLCEDCLYGKQTKKHSRIPHRQDPTRRELVKGARLHSDFAGGGNIKETLGGHKYCLSFIDDATDRLWIYMLKRKSEVPSVCKRHFTMMPVQGHPVKFFQTDTEQIYAGQPTQDVCKEQGIQWEPSAPYSPNQNPVAEQTSRTLFGRVRKRRQSWVTSDPLAAPSMYTIMIRSEES